jgi:5-methylcytosine-specific restriction enzyme subunit McrC
MKNNKNHISVFEHERLKLHQKGFDEPHLLALQQYHGDKGTPFFSLLHKGVKFNSHVGVIKVGELSIEVLPKADKNSRDDVGTWRKLLIGMIRSVGLFTIHAPTSAALSLKHDFILDLYFDLFLREVEYLFHKGLINQYRKTEGNRFALKGSLLFGKHIQQNLVHQERFYVRHSIYDQAHLLHQLLYKTLLLLKRINTNRALKSRIGALLLHFPEMKDLTVTEATFNKIVYNRKTESYQEVMKIVRLLLLNYHPDLSRGRNDVLALMFDMNALWERFVFVSLRKHLDKSIKVKAQNSQDFWRPTDGRSRKVRPDILIRKGEKTIILDTKWKNIGKKPSVEDLRQMYVYAELFKAQKVALVFPGVGELVSGEYYDATTDKYNKECALLPVGLSNGIESVVNIKRWQEMISKRIEAFLVSF